MKYFTEKKELGEKWVENYCFDNWQSCVRYQKEESGIYHPDNMLPDGSVDKSLE